MQWLCGLPRQADRCDGEGEPKSLPMCPLQANREPAGEIQLKREIDMPKEGIHPKYDTIHVKCACGNTFETRSTNKGDIVVEICAQCHPFFTGKQKLVDTAGRVDRFRRKVANVEAAKAAAASGKK